MKQKDFPAYRLHSAHSMLLAVCLTAITASTWATEDMEQHAHTMHHDTHDHGAMTGSGATDHSQHMQALKTVQGQDYLRSVDSYTLPPMELVDMHGTPVDVDALLNADQPLMLNFIFTSCTTICPIMSATFSQAQKRMGEAAQPVRWVSISIDPEYDTPERLREYATHFYAGPNWHFITGDLESIIALQKAFHVYNGSKMNHKPVTLLRAGRDQPWVRLEGLTSGSELVTEYRQLAQR